MVYTLIWSTWVVSLVIGPCLSTVSFPLQVQKACQMLDLRAPTPCTYFMSLRFRLSCSDGRIQLQEIYCGTVYYRSEVNSDDTTAFLRACSHRTTCSARLSSWYGHMTCSVTYTCVPSEYEMGIFSTNVDNQVGVLNLVFDGRTDRAPGEHVIGRQCTVRTPSLLTVIAEDVRLCSTSCSCSLKLMIHGDHRYGNRCGGAIFHREIFHVVRQDDHGLSYFDMKVLLLSPLLSADMIWFRFKAEGATIYLDCSDIHPPTTSTPLGPTTAVITTRQPPNHTNKKATGTTWIITSTPPGPTAAVTSGREPPDHTDKMATGTTWRLQSRSHTDHVTTTQPRSVTSSKSTNGSRQDIDGKKSAPTEVSPTDNRGILNATQELDATAKQETWFTKGGVVGIGVCGVVFGILATIGGGLLIRRRQFSVTKDPSPTLQNNTYCADVIEAETSFSDDTYQKLSDVTMADEKYEEIGNVIGDETTSNPDPDPTGDYVAVGIHDNNVRKTPAEDTHYIALKGRAKTVKDAGCSVLGRPKRHLQGRSMDLDHPKLKYSGCIVQADDTLPRLQDDLDNYGYITLIATEPVGEVSDEVYSYATVDEPLTQPKRSDGENVNLTQMNDPNENSYHDNLVPDCEPSGTPVDTGHSTQYCQLGEMVSEEHVYTVSTHRCGKHSDMEAFEPVNIASVTSTVSSQAVDDASTDGDANHDYFRLEVVS